MRSTTFLLALAVLPTLVAPAAGSVFQNSRRWEAGSEKYTIIPICVVEGSSAAQKGYGADAGLIHEANPSLAQVIVHVRRALAQTWENYSNVRFTGWQPCQSLSSSAREGAVGLLIHKDANNESRVGTDARGRTTFSNFGVSFKPFGPSFAKCVKYNSSSTHVEYTFDCAEQYAIHEFGHTIGFMHEWISPAKPSTCSTNDSITTSYDRHFNPDEDHTIVNPDSYDWDSIMTYNSDCAHVTGVRFGSTKLSAWDIAGVQEVYPPVWAGFHDVGVLAGSAGCGANDMVYVHMDSEHDDAASSATNWTGASVVAPVFVNLAFCRIDGDHLGKISAPSGSGDYAVLLLGTSCPGNSTEFIRYFDNEDKNNETYIAGAAGPNRYNFGGTGTELHFCLFRQSSPGYTMSRFPVYPFEYGVFAAPDFWPAVGTGSIHVDDEDDDNKNSWTYFDTTMEQAVSRIMSGGRNTDIRIAQVTNAGVPLTVNIQPAGWGVVTPPSGLYPLNASIRLQATAKPGYRFKNWDGPVSTQFTAATDTSMTAPVTLTANFQVLATSLVTNLSAKTGPADARVWTVTVDNKGPGATPGLEVNMFQLVQVAGAPCTPVVKDRLPKAMPDIAPGASGQAGVTIDFSRCEAAARFTLNYAVTTPSGAYAWRTLYNQFR